MVVAKTLASTVALPFQVQVETRSRLKFSLSEAFGPNKPISQFGRDHKDIVPGEPAFSEPGYALSTFLNSHLYTGRGF